MARSVPVRALSRVDLPTLGRPMMAILVSCSTKEPWERRRRSGVGSVRGSSVGGCRGRSRGRSSSSSIVVGFGEHGFGGFDDSAGFGEGGEDLVEEVADAGAVLGGDGEDVGEAEAAEVFGGGGEGGGVDFVDGEEDGLAAAEEEAGEFEVGGGELGAAVDDHDDGVASVRATWAWRKISAGMRASSSGTTPPVSTMRASRDCHSMRP
jgi:hypothetical protein